jgi:guanylate kinase
LQEARDQGRDVLLDIDCQGAAQLKRTCPDGVFIFILPPTFEELERRLRGRNTDTPEVIGRRLANARREMRELVWYDYLVVNDDLSRASEELKGIILAEGCRTGRTRDSVVQQFGIDKQEF